MIAAKVSLILYFVTGTITIPDLTLAQCRAAAAMIAAGTLTDNSGQVTPLRNALRTYECRKQG